MSGIDDSLTGDNMIFNAKQVENQCDDNGPMKDGHSDEGRTKGRMHDGQTIQSKNCLLVYRSIVT